MSDDRAPRGDPFDGPHADAPVLRAGAPLEGARAAVLLVHGRGGTAEDILGLAPHLTPGAGAGEVGNGVAGSVAFLAPQASPALGRAWYPYSFLQPVERNEPGLSSALALLERVLERVAAAGIPPERTVLAGFSQGACLALERAWRSPRRWGGLIAFSGGLIGAEPGDPGAGSFGGTPLFLGVSDRDPHIPVERARVSAGLLESLGAEVDLRVYPGMPHTVTQEQVERGRAVVTRALAAP